MELKIHLTPRAGADLDEIKAYLTPRDADAAERVRRRIEQAVDTISFFPNIGRPTNIQGICVLPVARYPYLIYHAIRSDTLTVMHIRHTSREVPDLSELT